MRRFLVMVLLSGLGLIILGVLMGSLAGLFNSETTPDKVREILDGYIQTANNHKPFSYSIVSLNKVNQSYATGEVWCAVIAAPVQENGASKSHLVLIKSPNGSWNALNFETINRDLQNWMKIGCTNW
jgi:hypothetical protein